MWLRRARGLPPRTSPLRALWILRLKLRCKSLLLTKDSRRLPFRAKLLMHLHRSFVRALLAMRSPRRLGDVGANAPGQWRWGGPSRLPHLAIMMYGKEGAMEQCEAEFKGSSWDVAFEVLERLTTSYLGDVEPFGFVDGVSQPVVDREEKRKIKGDKFTYSNIVSLGEFLLGYSNEYNEYTDRPLLDPSSRGASELLHALDEPQKKDSVATAPSRDATVRAGRSGLLAVHGPRVRLKSRTE